MRICPSCKTRNYSGRFMCSECKHVFDDKNPDETEYHPMSRAEMLDLLHRCQNGDASCLFTLKEFERESENAVKEAVELAMEEAKEASKPNPSNNTPQ